MSESFYSLDIKNPSDVPAKIYTVTGKDVIVIQVVPALERLLETLNAEGIHPHTIWLNYDAIFALNNPLVYGPFGEVVAFGPESHQFHISDPGPQNHQTPMVMAYSNQWATLGKPALVALRDGSRKSLSVGACLVEWDEQE